MYYFQFLIIQKYYLKHIRYLIIMELYSFRCKSKQELINEINKNMLVKTTKNELTIIPLINKIVLNYSLYIHCIDKEILPLKLDSSYIFYGVLYQDADHEFEAPLLNNNWFENIFNLYDSVMNQNSKEIDYLEFFVNITFEGSEKFLQNIIIKID